MQQKFELGVIIEEEKNCITFLIAPHSMPRSKKSNENSKQRFKKFNLIF